MKLIRGINDGIFAIIIPLIYDRHIYQNYLDIIILHSLGILIPKMVYFPIFIQQYRNYLDILLLFFWKLPIYLIGILYNNYKINLMVKYYKNSIKLDYKYDKFSLYLSNMIYYNLLIIFMSLLTKIFYFSKYYYYLDILITSFIYSIYCWEFYWDSNRVSYLTRYGLIISNYNYLIGYGFFFGMTRLYSDNFIQFHLLSILLPLNSVYTFRCKKLEINKQRSLLFKIPIQLTNILLRIVRWIQ